LHGDATRLQDTGTELRRPAAIGNLSRRQQLKDICRKTIE